MHYFLAGKGERIEKAKGFREAAKLQVTRTYILQSGSYICMTCFNELMMHMRIVYNDWCVPFFFQAQQTSTNRKKSVKKMVKRGGKEENSEDFLDPEIPFGEKKRLYSQMAKQQSPTAVEKSYVLFFF